MGKYRWDGEHTVYRLFDRAGDLLYVGMTVDSPTRLGAHARDKGWWHEVARTELSTYPTRQDALNAERQAIVAEAPRHNIKGNPLVDRVEPMPEELSRAVAEQIRSLMEARQISGYALAKATGIPQSSISRKLNHAAPFDLADLARIAEVFGVKAADLIAWAERPAHPPE